ncbi:unnamed protein product [Rotaria magnacalcarata]|uniref:NAD(P)(+)--arginine ADP-ribosyltransferase n=1 Tax=Rotaria magnacalcarata TaxID=392030 RepID=A0A815CR64_9BILA|nr:unnamed protein product [Rotaria magnacalcarata]CAF1291117.1 unnamed protein product [Rotaria magnacalcarata]CAF2050442.1 unnamed protein product [Rotaria magnacalcarata]CAF2062277.1 unnamed protein product [Rotaria magnacalcarata]CAF2253252.1 unnamed protein product [Rotaria magnacalcarata]
MAQSKYASRNVDNTSELKQNLRYSDIGDLPDQTLLPIEGYQHRKCLPLELAFKSVKDLSNIDPKIETAKENSQHPSDGLTRDESAAIQMYTMEWSPHKTCVYYLLNRALRLANRELLKPWFNYLKLILSGLYKLESFKGTVWRGVKIDLSQEYPTGATFIWWGFSSCTLTLDILQSEVFLGTTGPRTLFNIHCENGKDIRYHSYLKKENEILLLPGRKFRVVGNVKIAPDAYVIELQEIVPKFPLLADPTDMSGMTGEGDDEGVLQSMGSYVQDIIRKRRTSSSIEINGQQLNDQDIELVANELKLNRNWRTMDLASNGITDSSVNYLCEGLNNNCKLSVLYVCNNRISDRGTKSIARTLQTQRTLQELSLTGNGITDRSCDTLADMLKVNEALERLLLSENEITDKGIHYILHALTNVNDTLKELDLRKNQLTDKCIDDIVEMLERNSTLTTLNLQENHISEQGQQRIKKAAKKNKNLTELQL